MQVSDEVRFSVTPILRSFGVGVYEMSLFGTERTKFRNNCFPLYSFKYFGVPNSSAGRNKRVGNK